VHFRCHLKTKITFESKRPLASTNVKDKQAFAYLECVFFDLSFCEVLFEQQNVKYIYVNCLLEKSKRKSKAYFSPGDEAKELSTKVRTKKFSTFS